MPRKIALFAVFVALFCSCKKDHICFCEGNQITIFESNDVNNSSVSTERNTFSSVINDTRSKAERQCDDLELIQSDTTLYQIGTQTISTTVSCGLD